MMQIGGAHTALSAKRAFLCKTLAIEMGCVPRCFSELSGSGVDLTPMKLGPEHGLAWPPLQIAAVMFF